MSKIGNKPITIPDGVEIKVEGDIIVVKGPLGELKRNLRDEIEVSIEENILRVKRRQETRLARSLHGLYRALIANMVKGVKEGFKKELLIVGTGYNFKLSGRSLEVSAGYTSPVKFTLPEGVEGTVEKNTKLILKSIDNELLGNVAARIRSIRPVEPYKGKGIRYADEVVLRKAGKAGSV